MTPNREIREFHEITVPAHTIVAAREVIRTDEMHAYFDRAFTRAVEALAAVGAQPAGAARAYYFSPLSDTVDLAGGFPVPGEVVPAVEQASPELVHHIPEARVLTTRHLGGYDSLGRTWQELMDHVTAAGLATGPVFWEEYVTMPTPDADPADMITDLYVSLA